MQPLSKVPSAYHALSLGSETEIDDPQTRATFWNVDLAYAKQGLRYLFFETIF